MINAGEYDGCRDPFGPEERFCLAVERLVKTMFDRERAGDPVGYRLCICETLRPPAVGQCSHLFVGEAHLAADGSMRVQLIRRLPDRTDRQNDDLPAALAQRCVFLLGDRKIHEGRRNTRRQ